jgi:hypothetical protein
MLQKLLQYPPSIYHNCFYAKHAANYPIHAWDAANTSLNITLSNKMMVFCIPICHFVCSSADSNEIKPCLEKTQLWNTLITMSSLKIPVTE